MELEYKPGALVKIAGRHVTHVMTSTMKKGEKEVIESRDELIRSLSEQSKRGEKSDAKSDAKPDADTEEMRRMSEGDREEEVNKLLDLFPDDILSMYMQDVGRINMMLSRSLSGDVESITGALLQVQGYTTQMLVNIEADTHAAIQYGRAPGRALFAVVMKLVALTSTVAFMQKSMESRAEQAEELLNGPSPSKVAGALRVTFTQKAFVARTINELSGSIERVCLETCDQADAMIDDGEDYLEALKWIKPHVMTTLMQQAEVLLDDDVTESFVEPCKQRAIRLFTNNSGRAAFVNYIDGQLKESLIDRMSRQVEDKLAVLVNNFVQDDAIHDAEASRAEANA